MPPVPVRRDEWGTAAGIRTFRGETGISGIGRWVMGSTADRVLRTSPIPVLLVRSGAIVEQADPKTAMN